MFADESVEPGRAYDYELTVETAVGDPVSRTTSVAVPAIATTLGQNSPNPFNPLTTFTYTLAAPAQVSIAIYDVRGALIARIEQGTMPAGRHRAQWAGHNGEGDLVSSGVYFYRLEGAGDVPARRMVLLK
jgi:flagellar hook assembly protein FlgD